MSLRGGIGLPELPIKEGKEFRLGIMGGTFDPIHYGHLVTAEQARESLDLDAVLFMPAGSPAFKLDKPVTPAEDRYAMTFLATAANTAPFIGLFGTVWGIMSTFHAIGAMKSASLATVAPGISEALIATAMGLLVAIPATIGYNTFHGRLGVLETRLVNFAGMFLNRVQRELNAHRAVSRAGQTE